jgi:hypothetical protein
MRINYNVTILLFLKTLERIMKDLEKGLEVERISVASKS